MKRYVVVGQYPWHLKEDEQGALVNWEDAKLNDRIIQCMKAMTIYDIVLEAIGRKLETWEEKQDGEGG